MIQAEAILTVRFFWSVPFFDLFASAVKTSASSSSALELSLLSSLFEAFEVLEGGKDSETLADETFKLALLPSEAAMSVADRLGDLEDRRRGAADEIPGTTKRPRTIGGC